MQAWQRQIIQLGRQSAALGQTLNFLAQLDSWVSEFIIFGEGVIGTAAATANPEGLSALLQQVRITGTLPSGNPISPINNLRGPQLNEIAQFIRSNVSFSYGSLGSTGNFGFYIPCTFEQPRMGSLAFIGCIPAGTMGSLSINVSIALQSGVDTNGSATFALTSMQLGVEQRQFYPATVPQNSPYYLITLDQVVNANPQGGTQQQLFPNGSAYMLILIRSMASTAANTRTCITKQTDAGQVPVDASPTAVGLNLQDAANLPKTQSYWGDMRKANLDQITDALVAGNICFQFNRGISDVWRPGGSSQQIPLNYTVNTTGTTLPLIEFVYQRLFDPANTLQLQ